MSFFRSLLQSKGKERKKERLYMCPLLDSAFTGVIPTHGTIYE
jgi:hypothetical protein